VTSVTGSPTGVGGDVCCAAPGMDETVGCVHCAMNCAIASNHAKPMEAINDLLQSAGILSLPAVMR